MAKYLKSVAVPVIYYILVETDNDNEDELLSSCKQLVLDLLEENWDEQFAYDDQVMEFEGFDWVQGGYAHTIEERDDETAEATEDGTGEAGGELRSAVGDVQGARERDEGLPM